MRTQSPTEPQAHRHLSGGGDQRHCQHRFSAIFMIFMDFGAWMPKDGKNQAVARIESFTRFQLAAIIDFHRFSTIFMIFMDFGAWMPKDDLRTVSGR